jgi:predicted metal-dependent HD superfamily phosphohydrolase
MDYSSLLDNINHQLLPKFEHAEKEGLLYHNLRHTKKVMSVIEKMAIYYQLNGKEQFIISAAVMFHAAGYLSDYSNPEKAGAKEASLFFQRKAPLEKIMTTVKECILATKMPHQAKNRLEEIVCDAVLFHLGTNKFLKDCNRMRKEASIKKNIPLSKATWCSMMINLFETHHFFTDYCQDLYYGKKLKNLEKLKMKVKNLAEPKFMLSHEEDKLYKIKETIKDHSLTNLQKSQLPKRGIETMFRITSSNNQRLSDMADNKAQIMITVNSIILSAIISLILRKLEEYFYLAIPTYIILTVCVVTIIFSILATRPSLPLGMFTQQQLKERKVNLLFFGNFYRMDFEQYAEGMFEIMNNREVLYGTLIRDIHTQGVVLGKKYRLLRISYNIFMFGLTASVLAFVIASIITSR